MDSWTDGQTDGRTDGQMEVWTDPPIEMCKTHLKIHFYPYIVSYQTKHELITGKKRWQEVKSMTFEVDIQFMPHFSEK